MFSYQVFQRFLFIRSWDERTKKILESLIFLLIPVSYIGISFLAMPGKSWIIYFVAILKSPDETGQFPIVMDKVFSNSFERPQCQKLFVEFRNYYLMIPSCSYILLRLLIELQHSIYQGLYPWIGSLMFLCIHLNLLLEC